MFLKTLDNCQQPIQKRKTDENLVENLEDDESIIRLLASLKNNPPPLIERMNQVNIKNDGKLTQTEFQTFLEKLKISKQDILSLLRVVGFFNGRTTISHPEFKQILIDRPKVREIQEIKLFKKILREVKNKNMTVERLFYFIDINNDKEITPGELKDGFNNLKIILSQKDFNNIFNIFDKDKNNTISIDEMKSTLEYYEQQEEQEQEFLQLQKE